jgi:putative ABC transport system substrate-binding protein
MRIRPCDLRALALLLFVTPLCAGAQASGKIPRIAFVVAGTAECPPDARDQALREGLLQLGYVPGKSVALERKCYRDTREMHSALKEAIEHKADVVLVGVPVAAIAARRITRDIPIVCVSCGDPLDYGLVDSLARPGGNVTGLASLSAELVGKRLQLLRQVSPQATRLAALVNPDNPGTQANLRALEHAAPALGFALQRIDFRSPADFDPAFRSAAAAGAHAVLVQDDPFTLAGRAAIGQLSLKHRLPVIAGIPEVADAGALIVYGPDRNELYRRAAGFVDRILKGAKPADLPIEQPATFDLIINLKSAKALGVPLSQDLLARANRVIQ